MNPRELPLDKQTHFVMRAYVDLQVDVPPKKPEMNGFDTAQRVAEHKVYGVLRSALRAEQGEMERKGVRFQPDPHDTDDDIALRVIPYDPDWMEPVERLFTRFLHMGWGDYSQRDCSILLARLSDCFSWLSGVQQMGTQGDPYDEEEAQKVSHRIENVVRDIAMALTGKEIQFVEEKPDGIENS